MATELTLRRADGQPFGSFERVQACLRELFPAIEFYWTPSGPEYLALAAERGIEYPPVMLTTLPNLPSLLEGVAEGDGWHVTFGLGHQEPVSCLYVTPRGLAPELDRGLSALEEEAKARFKVSGDE
jgi:hypothetical protein